MGDLADVIVILTPLGYVQMRGDHDVDDLVYVTILGYVQMRGDHDVDDLVDVIEGNRIYTPCLYVLNKIDQITLEELEVIDRMENYVPICAYHEWNLDGVLEAVWDKLDLIRCAHRCCQLSLSVNKKFGLPVI